MEDPDFHENAYDNKPSFVKVSELERGCLKAAKVIIMRFRGIRELHQEEINN